MRSVSRRGWLLVLAGAPVVLGLTAQALSVRLDNDYLRVSAPGLHFLKGKPLQRIKDGNTVGFLGQLTVLTGELGPVQSKFVAHFGISHDIWEEMNAGFRVTLITPGPVRRSTENRRWNPSAKKLSDTGAEAWCLEQLRIDFSDLPAGRQIWVRLEMRSEDDREKDRIVGTPGISLSKMIEVFSHPVKDEQVRVSEEIGPLNVDDLRKPHS